MTGTTDPQIFHQPRRHRWLALGCMLLGAIIAGALTWFMYSLIQSGNTQLNESDRIHFADFIHAKQQEQTRIRERLPEKPVVSKAPPTPAAAQDSNALDGEVISISDIAIDTQIGRGETKLGFGSGDGEYLPIVKVAPLYPMQAKARKIEGICTVQYTVTTAGTVEDVVVLKDRCTHETFYKPSVNAALKFKYKPRVIDGTAVKVHGVKNRFVFKLQRAE